MPQRVKGSRALLVVAVVALSELRAGGAAGCALFRPSPTMANLRRHALACARNATLSVSIQINDGGTHSAPFRASDNHAALATRMCAHLGIHDTSCVPRVAERVLAVQLRNADAVSRVIDSCNDEGKPAKFATLA